MQRQVLTEGSLPPVWAALYEDPALIRRFPYLPTLQRSVAAARPRLKSPRYDQVSLAVQAVMHDALTRAPEHGRESRAWRANSGPSPAAADRRGADRRRHDRSRSRLSVRAPSQLLRAISYSLGK